MKIIFHHNCLEHGGAERVISTLSNQLSSQGHDVVVATEWQGEEEFELNKEIRRIHVGLDDSDENRSRIFRAIKRLVRLRKLLVAEKADVAIGFTRKPLYRLLAASICVKTPVIIAVRISPIGNYDKAFDKIFMPILFRRANGAVFQTNDQMEYFVPFLKNDSAVIFNPINEKYVGVEQPAKKEKAIVHSGRLVDFKNQPMLIRAFIKVHDKHPEYVLKLYGPDGGEGMQEKLEEIIKSSHAEEFVKLMGGSDELEKVLPMGEIYAMSSDYEGMPNALLEAMCLGMPVVATDCPCGGPKAVITEGENGLLVPVKDEDAFAEALNKLIENPEYANCLGKQASKLSEKISAEAITKQWLDYINKVIKRK